MKRCFILLMSVILWAVIFAGCHDANMESSNAPELSGSLEAPESDDVPSEPKPAPSIETVLSLFEGKIMSEFGLDIQSIEFLETVPVQGDGWYKFHVITEYEKLSYLVNSEVNRLYIETTNTPMTMNPQLAMYEVYWPAVEDPYMSVSEDQYLKLTNLLFEKTVSCEGEEIAGMDYGIQIVSNEFCLVIIAADIGDMEYTYVATYAISLDGERYYKLGEDGFFHEI